MKSGKIICAVAAAAMSFSSLSFAQPNNVERGDYRSGYQQQGRDGRDGDRRDGQRWNNDRRGDRNFDRGDYRHGRADQYYYNARGPEWRRGGYIPHQYRGSQYVVNDWRGHRLHAPPRGYHWVQVGSDYVLVAIATGIITQLLLNSN